MSNNPNFYSNFRGNNCTFQRFPSYPVPPPPPPPPHFVPPPALPPPHYVPPPPHFVPQAPQQYIPPPPQPPPFFIPSATPAAKRENADQDFLSTFENGNPVKEPIQPKDKYPSITEGKKLIRDTLLAVVDLQRKETRLTENMSTLTEEEWTSHMKEIAVIKAEIGKAVTLVTGPYVIRLRKSKARRKAKRLRLKRLNLEKKREKEERIKELKERSRKIDENLQKIKDDINKAKQEEEEKLQADIVLKEVLRKKSDAKKCLTKLDALVNLRKARQNTAIGRGETVSESETAAFHTHISKLKSLWELKLLIYEKEESDLRAQLKQDSEVQSTLQAERETSVASNLAKWRELLFGGKLPQVDFGGDVARFLEVRSQWDRYISNEGTPLPVGWVTPAPMKDEEILDTGLLQEEEEKLQADIVLKEVLRKKSDAKKCLTKLDALVNLRKARQNTAIGRGETVSESETAAFHTHIGKLKSLWELKLLIYEKEESDLRAQLKQDSEVQSTLQAERETSVASNLAKWRELLFGGKLPQVDFGGDVARFLEVRSQWDRYISNEGTPLPVGWVTPAPMKDEEILE